MMKLLVLALFCALAAAQLGPGTHKLTITGRPEGTRTFYVYVPVNYAAAVSPPVVFAWHGLGNKCEDFAGRTSYNGVADRNNFLVVYPCGTGLAPAFNAGVCCEGIPQTDDYEYARLMFAQVKSNWAKINSSRVFTSGFSNGGMMSEVLACKEHRLFRAAASVAGVTTLNPGNLEGLTECDKAYANASRNVGVLLIHGNADPTVPWNGNPLLRFPPIPTDFKRWADRNKCVGAPVNTYKQGVYSNQVYQSCGAAKVELVTVDGGKHAWPNEASFSSAEYAWKFFSQF